MSMNPGATTWPRPSITRRAGRVERRSIATTRPSWTLTSASRPGAPVPSMRWPPRISRSSKVLPCTTTLMKIGFHLTPFWSPADRAPAAIIDEAVQVVRASSELGFAWVSMGHHWISHPTVWPQPMPMLARLAPETGAMRLKTSMLLLPILNAVETAESIATLDHICHGRLDVGVAIGYREKELEI